MNTQFDWETDDKPAAIPAQTRRKFSLSRRQRWFLWIAVALLLMFGLAGWLLWQRQEMRRQRVEQDVLASFQIWRQAVNQADGELFAYLLSREDADWQRTQKLLFNSGKLLNRAPFGLKWVQTAVPNPILTIAPDWQSVELQFEQDYEAGTDLDALKAVRLRQTAVYQYRDERWLQSAPPAGFWGATQNIAGDRLTLLFPERDAELAQQLWQDLEKELQQVCDQITATGGRACDEHDHLQVELVTGSEKLAEVSDLHTPLFNGRALLLPAPTLVGVPMDESSYYAFLKGYAGRVVELFETNLSAPAPLPEQAVYSLCLTYPGDGATMQRYDPFQNKWSTMLPERNFRFLDALPDDSALVLHETPSSQEPNRLRLSLFTPAQETLLVDDNTHQWQPRPVGWAQATSRPRLLLQGADLVQATTFYRWLDLRACSQSGCAVEDLAGFAAWSPDGVHMLLVQESQLFLGNADGENLELVGTGFNPFWVDEKTYAYARFVHLPDYTTMEIAARQIGSEKTRVLFNADDLAAAVDITERGKLFFKYIAPSPGDSNLILVAATGIGAYAGEYFIFSVELEDSGSVVMLRERRRGAPSGYPSLLTPTGYPPFSFSPDGRWLVFSELTGAQKDSWLFYLHNLQRNETQIVQTTFPAYPARYPFYDWSADGHWLVIVDDGFMRLVAPDYDFQRLVPHEYDACFFTAWMND